MKKERHILVVFPHPDDETYAAAGTLAMHAAQGTPITYACWTLGEMGRNVGRPPSITRESLPKIRKKELIKASEIIGISDLRMLGFRDKTLEFEKEETLVSIVENIVREVRPSLVISFYPGYSVHPDHEASARAVVKALRRLKEEERPTLYCVAFARNHEQKIGKPDVVIDISPYVEIKKAALYAHLSQTAWQLVELEKKWAENDEEAWRWIRYERFWTYPL